MSLSRHRYRHVRRQGDADRPSRQGARRSHRQGRRAGAPASRLVASRTRPTGGAPRSRRIDTLASRIRPRWPQCAASAFPATCTARRCWARTTRSCAPASSGTTAARRPNAPRWKRALPTPARDRRQHRHARLHRAQDRLGAQARAGDLRQDRQGAAAQGLCPAAADRRACRGNVATPPARSGSTSASATGRTSCSRVTGLNRSHMPRLVEGSAPSGELKPELASALGHDRQGRRRRRRRRQRRRRLRHRRHPAGRGLRVARHLGRAVRLQRHASGPTPRAPSTPSATPSPTPGTRWA